MRSSASYVLVYGVYEYGKARLHTIHHTQVPTTKVNAAGFEFNVLCVFVWVGVSEFE
jgi:hypothetical protein